MPRTTTVTVRLNGALRDFVSANVGENGAYANVNEYIRDLIRRDQERWERQAFDRLKAELKLAFATPDASFQSLSASDVTREEQGSLVGRVGRKRNPTSSLAASRGHVSPSPCSTV